MTTLDLLVFGAHPDDAEIGMGGTIYKHTSNGFKVGICDLTFAELSSNGDQALRQHEASKAAEILHLTMRSNLGLPDRGLKMKSAHIKKVTEEIRKHRPKVVFAPYWHDRHPDHVTCSKLVREAVFNAKLRKFMPHIAAWTVENMYYYYINDQQKPPDLVVDVSAQYDVKIKALAAYESQFSQGKDTVSTPLNTGYVQHVELRDQLLGHQQSVAYAEGFASELPLMVDTF